VRVERTFVFLDLCDFTKYMEFHGDEAALAVLAQLRATLRAVSAGRGVCVDKWLGDGAMLSGSEPVSVALCAAEVLERIAVTSPLPLRGGIARGPAMIFEGEDYVGLPANLAARLCRAAEPNRLLATADALADVETSAVIAVARPDIAIKGITGPVAVTEIVVARQPPSAGDRSSHGRMSGRSRNHGSRPGEDVGLDPPRR
jgi:class 3 adenylate cyclase